VAFQSRPVLLKPSRFVLAPHLQCHQDYRRWAHRKLRNLEIILFTLKSFLLRQTPVSFTKFSPGIAALEGRLQNVNRKGLDAGMKLY
jgi:hypothetical protein